MELSFAFLALNADFTDDKSLWVAGADFERMAVIGVPATAQFTLVIKLRVSPREVESPHYMRIDITDPSGERKALNSNQLVPTMVNEKFPNRMTGSLTIARMAMPFNMAGEYTFHIILDEHEVKSIPLLVELSEAPV